MTRERLLTDERRTEVDSLAHEVLTALAAREARRLYEREWPGLDWRINRAPFAVCCLPFAVNPPATSHQPPRL